MQLNTIDGIVTLPPLTVEYRLDPVVDIVHNKIPYEQGYTFEYHTMFKNVRDYSINKNTNFYLTDEYNIQDILTLKQLPSVYPETITTFLAFNRLTTDPMSALSADNTCITHASAASASEASDTTTVYVTVGDGVVDPSVGNSPVSAELFTDIKTQDTLRQKYYFNVTFINGTECLVYHLSGDTRYYLHVDKTIGGVSDDETLTFMPIEHEPGLENDVDTILTSEGAGTGDPRYGGGEKILWLYTYYPEEDLLRIFKYINGQINVLHLNTSTATETSPGHLELTPTIDPDKDGDSGTSSPNVLELTDTTTMRLRPRTTKITNARINSKIFNYQNNPDQNNVDVDLNRVTPELANNMLVHSEYYYLTGNALPVNLFPMKNQHTSTGIVSPGNLWSETSKELGNNNVEVQDHKHRRYNKIFTGTNQLEGSDKIYLDYTCATHDIEFKPGMNYFNFPVQPEPITRVNINDTKLIECGSVASHLPICSDKVYKKQAGYKSTTRWGEPSNEQTGMWLCTWLSGSNDPTEAPVWVDRYYNPSNTGGVNALTLETQHMHNTYETDTNDQFVSSNAEVYDEVSKLTFEPGSFYAYYRVNDKDNSTVTSFLDPFQIGEGLDIYTTTNFRPVEPSDSEYTFNNDRVGVITKLKDRDLDQLTIMFDFNFKNYKQLIGHQILGNYTDTGFGVYNANNVSPFMFIKGSDGVDTGFQPLEIPNRPQDSSIRLYDNNFNMYNYITNSSHVPLIANEEGEQAYAFDTGLFEHIIVKELPENIYAVMSTGQIVEMTHDGAVVATYDDVYNNVTGARSPYTIDAPHLWGMYSEPFYTLSDVAYDERYIYVLQHTIQELKVASPTPDNDYIITAFDTLNKTFEDYTDHGCINTVIPPESLTQLNDDALEGIFYGRSVYNTGSPTPPNKIVVKDDPEPYQEHRGIYLLYGDVVKTSSKIIWVHVNGQTDTGTNEQLKHDVIYGYDIQELQLIGDASDTPTLAPGMITGGGNQDKINNNEILPFKVIDFAIDDKDHLWLLHDHNYVTKMDTDRKILHSHLVENQSLLSIAITKDIENGSYVDRVAVVGKTVGEDKLGASLSNHPTTNIIGPMYRTASPYPNLTDTSLPLVKRTESSGLSGMETNIVPDSYTPGSWIEVTNDNIQRVNTDHAWNSPDNKQWVYVSDLILPFVDGANRFGAHTRGRTLADILNSDTVGTVQDGDYGLMTEGFDDIILEGQDTIFGNIYDGSNGKLIETKTLDNFPVSDVTNLPQLVNHYEYSKENYNHYYQYNLNLKMLLQPLFGRQTPDMVNIKLDLSTLNNAPYTDYHSMAIVIDNRAGRVEMWVDGNLDETNHVYAFDPDKYRFADVLNKNITVGATTYLNDTLLYNKVNRPESYAISDTVLKNICYYNAALSYHDQLSILRAGRVSESMIWPVPTGLRNYIEGIDRVYNHSIPPKKSNTFDIQIRNSLIESTQLQNYITNKIRPLLRESVPAGTNYRNIEWTNEILNTG